MNDYISLFDEVIFVDGNSNDGTWEIIPVLYPKATRIKQQSKVGKGMALLEGLSSCLSDYATILDVDRPVSIDEIVRMKKYCNLDNKYDLIKTSRNLPTGGSADLTLIRKIGSISLTKLTNIVHGVNWTEVCYGFWTIRKDFFLSLNFSDLYSRRRFFFPFHKIPYGWSFEFDQIIFIRSKFNGARILELPSFELSRQFGTSSLNAFIDGLRTLFVILNERFSK
jgi:glycosyltransferase involved in cell wall biosynthesis